MLFLLVWYFFLFCIFRIKVEGGIFIIRLESSVPAIIKEIPAHNTAKYLIVCRHLATVASKSAYNKMNATNLAIVLTPSLFPIQVFRRDELGIIYVEYPA